MKSTAKYLAFISLLIALSSCLSESKKLSGDSAFETIMVTDNANFNIEVKAGEYFHHPAIVFWIEDMDGNYLSTIFITKSYATGIYSHEMVGDTMWLNNPGPSIQPAALPYWTHKKGLINGKSLVPSPENPYVDAFTSATPMGNFDIHTEITNELGNYRILMEINQLGDWNSYWTNSKYPTSKAYSHSAQPSLIYAVTINNSDSVFYLNPIGHGDPTGETGILYTNLTTLTTSKEIIEFVKVEKKEHK